MIHSFAHWVDRSLLVATTVGEESGLVSRDNEGGFTGHKERLKESQAYSKEFGRAIVRAFLSHQQQ